MTTTTQKRLTLFAIGGLLAWFFGNLYEAFVISPNWVTDSVAQLTRLHGFFLRTSPAHYFLSLTQLSLVVVWVLVWLNRHGAVQRDYRNASWFALLATIVNVYIVSTLITRLFGADYASFGASLQTYAWRWNVLNVVRMALVATTVFHLFRAFCTLERNSGLPHAA